MAEFNMPDFNFIRDLQKKIEVFVMETDLRENRERPSKSNIEHAAQQVELYWIRASSLALVLNKRKNEGMDNPHKKEVFDGIRETMDNMNFYLTVIILQYLQTIKFSLTLGSTAGTVDLISNHGDFVDKVLGKGTSEEIIGFVDDVLSNLGK